jgi:transcriptional regulator with XRE-family HTH domain
MEAILTTTPTTDTRPTVAAATPDPIDIAVGARVRSLRIAAGMSQQRLGDAIGITYQQLHKYERGYNRIAASRLVQIARALGCSPASFFTEIEAPAPAAAPSIPALRLAAQIDRLCPANRTAIRNIVASAVELQVEHRVSLGGEYIAPPSGAVMARRVPLIPSFEA